MMQMLGIAHRKDCGIESDVVSSVKVVYYPFVLSKDLFRETEAKIRAVATLLVLWLHLDHDT
jgi:hypothetical protein